MKVWKDEEVKNLFTEVEKCKKDGFALKKAFLLHAKKYGRKENSVRNYYYLETKNLQIDIDRCSRLGVQIERHKKNRFVPFDKKEENSLLCQVEKLTKEGLSVRSACEKISGGDLTLMTRLQNKIQNIKRKGMSKDNVILFRQARSGLSENDINSLFLGLVKLIKKMAVEEVSEKMRFEKASSEMLLKKAFLDLNKKEKRLAELTNDFEILKNENKKLNDKLNKYFSSKTKKDILQKKSVAFSTTD